jgi:hypothetical protein
MASATHVSLRAKDSESLCGQGLRPTKWHKTHRSIVGQVANHPANLPHKICAFLQRPAGVGRIIFYYREAMHAEAALS